MSISRSRLRLAVVAVAAVLLAIVLIDALDPFDTRPWTEIPHGDHSHFVPNNKDEGVSISRCPRRPPAENEMLSSQCQILSLVVVGEKTHYVPHDRNRNVPTERFPTRPPGPGVLISPNGELAAAGSK